MKFIPKNYVKKFQTGGPMETPVPEEEQMVEEQPQQAPAEENPIMALAQASMQALQAQDCLMAMQVCQALVQLVQQAQAAASQELPEGEPVFKKGGVLLRRIKK